MVVVKGKRTGTLYFLADSGSSVSVATGDTSTVTTLWHRRLGHLSEKNLSILHRRELLPGLKKVNLEFCEECIYGKQKAVSFQLARTQKKTERLELVHSDV